MVIRKRLRRICTVTIAAAMLTVGFAASAWAQPISGGGSGGGGISPVEQHSLDCISDATTSLVPSSSSILYGQAVSINWSVSLPSDCTTIGTTITGLGFPSTEVAASGSVSVVPTTMGSGNRWTLTLSGLGGVSTEVEATTVTVNPVPAVSPIAVTANNSGDLDVVFTSSGELMHNVQATPDGAFSGWWSSTNDPPTFGSVATATNSDGKVEEFGINQTGNISWQEETSAGVSSWSGWTTMDGELMSIAAARNADGRLEVFGTNVSDQIYWRDQTAPDSGAWTNWSMFDGSLVQIAAVTQSNGEILVAGVNAAGSVYWRSQTAPNTDTWTAWSQMSGTLANLALAVEGDGKLVMAGTEPAGQLVEAVQSTPGGAWSAFTDIDDQNAGGPIAAATDGDGRVEIIGQGDVANSLETAHRAQVDPDSTLWTGWADLGVRATPSPILVACAQNPNCQTTADSLVTFHTGTSGADMTASVPNSASPGDYTSPTTIGTNVCPGSDPCQLADVNGDGTLDVVDTRTTGNTVQVALNNGGTGYDAPATWSTTACAAGDTCLLADMNHDGYADLVDIRHPTNPTPANPDGAVWVSESNGVNGFGPAQQWVASGACLTGETCELADVTGDGWPDLIALTTSGADAGEAFVTANTAAGPGGLGGLAASRTLWTSQSECTTGRTCVMVDQNQDGMADLAVLPSVTDTDIPIGDVWLSTSTGSSFAAVSEVDPTSSGRFSPDDVDANLPCSAVAVARDFYLDQAKIAIQNFIESNGKNTKLLDSARQSLGIAQGYANQINNGQCAGLTMDQEDEDAPIVEIHK